MGSRPRRMANLATLLARGSTQLGLAGRLRRTANLPTLLALALTRRGQADRRHPASRRRRLSCSHQIHPARASTRLGPVAHPRRRATLPAPALTRHVPARDRRSSRRTLPARATTLPVPARDRLTRRRRATRPARASIRRGPADRRHRRPRMTPPGLANRPRTRSSSRVARAVRAAADRILPSPLLCPRLPCHASASSISLHASCVCLTSLPHTLSCPLDSVHSRSSASQPAHIVVGLSLRSSSAE